MQIQIPVCKNHEAQGTSTNTRLRSSEDIKDTIVAALRDIMGTEVDDDEPLIAQGLDSLAAMELRKRMQVQCLACTALDSYALSEEMILDCDKESVPEPSSCMYGIPMVCRIIIRVAMQEIWAVELTILIEDPAKATVKQLTTEMCVALNFQESPDEIIKAGQRSQWISPTPISIKMRLFCLPYAGGVSENIFAKYVPNTLDPITSMRADV